MGQFFDLLPSYACKIGTNVLLRCPTGLDNRPNGEPKKGIHQGSPHEESSVAAIGVPQVMGPISHVVAALLFNPIV